MLQRPTIATLLVVVLAALAGCGDSGSSNRSPSSVRQVENGPTSGSPSQPVPAGSASVPGAYKRETTTPSKRTVPILMYHVIGTPHPGAPLPDLWVGPNAFRTHVKALADAGYKAVTLDHVIDAWEGKATLPSKAVVFSFDDGYIGQGKLAGPILKAQNWPGVLYLVLHALGTPGGLTQSRIKTMISDGWEIDAHSMTHADMTTLDAAGLRREIDGSRKAIRSRFGVPVNSFAYPAGKYDDAAEKAVEDAGFSDATTVDPGAAKPGDDRYALPRVRVNGGDDGATVLRKVKSAGG